MASVEIVNADSRLELEKIINRRIANKEVTDIKFCVTPIIKTRYGATHSEGAEYYAMIIYKNWGKG